ncbi:MAG: response regulator [Pseudomonadota bacterium]
MRALAVDDSLLVRRVVSHFLSSLAFEVDAVSNGEEALAHLLREGAPDLIILDWNMPGMDGLEFLTRMRKLDRFLGIKVIMLTARNDMAAVQTAIAAGADEYMMKPFTPELLEEKIRFLGFDVGEGNGAK